MNEIDLIHDALFARRVKNVGCFKFNEAAEQVQEFGTPILAALEHVLRDEVMAVYPSDPKSQVHEFPGVANLLVAYFRITKDGAVERAADFVSKLCGPMLSEAIRAIHIVWNRVVPAAFSPILEKAARTGFAEEQKTPALRGQTV